MKIFHESLVIYIVVFIIASRETLWRQEMIKYTMFRNLKSKMFYFFRAKRSLQSSNCCSRKDWVLSAPLSDDNFLLLSSRTLLQVSSQIFYISACILALVFCSYMLTCFAYSVAIYEQSHESSSAIVFLFTHIVSHPSRNVFIWTQITRINQKLRKN